MIGNMMILALEHNGRTLFAEIDLQNGDAAVTAHINMPLSRVGMPFHVRATHEHHGVQMIVWPMRDGVAVMTDSASRRADVKGRHARELTLVGGLPRGSRRMHQPTNLEDEVICLTQDGCLFAFPAGLPASALSATSLLELARLKPDNAWLCGPPSVVSGHVLFAAICKESPRLCIASWIPGQKTIEPKELEQLHGYNGATLEDEFGGILSQPVESAQNRAFLPSIANKSLHVFSPNLKKLETAHLPFPVGRAYWVASDPAVYAGIGNRLHCFRAVRGAAKLSAHSVEFSDGTIYHSVIAPLVFDKEGVIAVTSRHIWECSL